MADNDQKELLAQGVAAVKQAKAQITELETANQELAAEKQARDEQAEAAKALGPAIVDSLIKAGRITEDARERAVENMGDPVKVAQELHNVLNVTTDVPAVGAPDESAEKDASGTTNPMQEVDDKHRARIGLT